ncbi:XrtA/PEP-CTERM system histidine kinase PrsK [Rhodoferax sp. U11-2br]|uniref:XrtA/PEP-CTERM system histidine kinase PrsK n=1 Tax=Rhodoferax sp. U11-2br TaxID=2838878 RepID=UPI001BE96AD6|nr:XrtA/PEP-CTERM system histidine kinase PrsK [Rhodoferax sp. U11-2br]MBT3068643.1 PEP-CTERM system histidine kinase PrsK [Rhodoferax sp. U11-2br]
MNSGNLDLTAWSGGLAGVCYTVFALRLLQSGYLKTLQETSKLAVLGAVLLSALWGWSTLLQMQTQAPLLPLLTILLDQLRYAAWFAFLLLLLRTNRAGKASTGYSLIIWAVLLAVSGPLSLVLTALETSSVGEPTRWMLFSAMAMPVFALVLLEQVFRNATEDSRWNIKPLSLGLAGSFLFDLYLFSQAVLFNRPDEDALSIRAGVHALMMPLLLLSSTRRSDWIAKIQLSPKAAFHSATLLIAGVYLIFISGVGYYVRYFGGEWGRALQLGLVVFALIVLMMLALSGTMRAKLKVFLGKHFFRYRYDYREEWLKFTRALSASSSPQELGSQVVRGLAEMVESPAGGLWLRAQGEAAFTQTARWNLAPTEDKEPLDTAMCQYLADGGRLINLEDYRSASRRYGSLKIPVWLQELPQAWLVVPLMVGEELTGFVVLASARTLFDVNWEVNDLLKTASKQAASYLAQMQATEALLEVRKFDAFNKMSAFVVHDLKNIVTQLSLMMKNAKRLGDNPEFQQDMLMTVENSLDRMRQLMLQLREGATPPGKAFGVNLSAIVTRVQAVAKARGRTLEVLALEPVDTRGHEERLERIIGHVVQNAFDATDPSGHVWLTLERAGGQASIVVKDTGQGMTQDFIRDRLFKPFQTTKQGGMGIGAYESFQYVQELGGKIDVQSEVNQGTTVTLLLPLFETQKNSDLHSLESA